MIKVPTPQELQQKKDAASEQEVQSIINSIFTEMKNNFWCGEPKKGWVAHQSMVNKVLAAAGWILSSSTSEHGRDEVSMYWTVKPA